MTPEQDIFAGIVGAPPARPQRTRGRSGALKFQPAETDWSLDKLPQLEKDYQERFGKPLPVRNRGQGPIHNRWHLQHGDSADIGLNPATPEGLQFLDFLEEKNYPYLAFDRAIPNVASGPHTHLGRPSHRGTGAGTSTRPRLAARQSPENDVRAGISPQDTNDTDPANDLAAGMVPTDRTESAVSTPAVSMQQPVAQDPPQTVSAAGRRPALSPVADTNIPAGNIPADDIPVGNTAVAPVERQIMTAAQETAPPVPLPDTELNPFQEVAFKRWKQKHALNDVDTDAKYDLRGAYKAGLAPDEKTGLLPDVYKRASQPTSAPLEDAGLHGELASPADRAAIGAEQQKPSQIDTVNAQAVDLMGRRHEQDVARRRQQAQNAPAVARRNKMIDEARQQWIRESEELAKNADPELAAKLINAARNSSTADVVKYARSKGLQTQDPRSLAHKLGNVTRGGLTAPAPTFGDTVPAGASGIGELRQQDERIGKLRDETRAKIISEAGGAENVARVKRDYAAVGRDPKIIDQKIDEQARARANDFFEREHRVALAESGQAPKLGWLDKVRELGDHPTKLIPFISGTSDIVQMLKLGSAADRMMGRGGPLTEEDKLLLREFDAQAKQDSTIWYKVADTVSMLPAFIGEFALTGGAYAAGKEAAKEGLEKLVTKAGMKKLESTLAGRVASKVGTGLVGAAAQTIPSGLTRIPAGTLYRENQGDGFVKALANAVGDQFIEVATERGGELLHMIPLPKRMAAIRDAVTARWLAKDPGRTMKALKKVAERTGWNGPLGEMFEERLGDIAHYAAGQQPSPIPSLEQLLVEGISFSLPDAGVAAAGKLASHVDRERAIMAITNNLDVDRKDAVEILKLIQKHGLRDAPPIPLEAELQPEPRTPERRSPDRVPQADWLDMTPEARDKIRASLEDEMGPPTHENGVPIQTGGQVNAAEEGQQPGSDITEHPGDAGSGPPAQPVSSSGPELGGQVDQTKGAEETPQSVPGSGERVPEVKEPKSEVSQAFDDVFAELQAEETAKAASQGEKVGKPVGQGAPSPIAVGAGRGKERRLGGEAYWSKNDANQVVSQVRDEFPDARVVQYDKGFAVQTGEGGDYLTATLRPSLETAPTQPAESAPRGNPKELRRQLAAVDKQIKTLRGGMDVAYDVAMNDKGASVRRLEAQIQEQVAKREQIVTALREAEVPASKGRPPSVGNKSVRDHPQRATLKGDSIVVDSYVGRQKVESYSIPLTEWEQTKKFGNPHYAKAKLIEKYTAAYDDQPGGPEQAARIRDAQRYAIDNLLKTAAQTGERPNITGALKTAASETGMGLSEIGKGLAELFKSGAKGGNLNIGPAFDAEVYAKAKPYFDAAMAHFQVAGASVKDAMSALLRYLRDVEGFSLDDILGMRAIAEHYIETRQAQDRSLDEKAHDAATSPHNDLPEPTQPQKEAGNYKKGHVRISGLDVTIENPEGSERKGIAPNGKAWSVKLHSHYGYILDTEGADEEHVDAYIRPGVDKDYSGPIYVVNQTKANGHFDEHKVMLGWHSEDEARKAYLANYEKGWDNYRDIVEFANPKEFKTWLDQVGQATRWAEAPSRDADAAREFLQREGIAFDPNDSDVELLTLAEEAGFREEPPNFGTVDKPDVPALARAFADHFKEGRSFSTIVEARKFAGELLGGKVEAGTQTAKMIDEAVELGAVMRARNIVTARREAEKVYPSAGAETDTYHDLVNLYEQQPTLSTRTSTSVAEQAYSTPVPLAYVASRLAGVTERTSVGEPTAGNGALLIEAGERRIVANELNPDRRANLAALLPGATSTIKSNDAAETPLAFAQSLDVVIANPPFGAVKEDGETKRFQVNERYNTAEIDHVIALKALEAMKDDGAAVLILGGVNSTDEEQRAKGYSGKAKLEFYVTLYGEYNVVDHFTVSGDLYKKQGAAWPVDVIVIQGRGKSQRRLPAADVPRIYNSWDELEGVLDEPYRKSLDARRVSERPEPQPARETGGRSGERTGSAEPRPRDVSEPTGQPTGRNDREGVGRTGGERGTDTVPDGQSERDAGRAGPRDVGRQGRSGSTERVPAPAGDTGQTAGTTAAEQPGRAEPVRGNESRELGQQPTGTANQPRSLERADLTSTQAAYRPSSKAAGLNTLVPLNMKASIEGALDRLVARVGDLDSFVARELGYGKQDIGEYFSAEQVDALAMAIDNIQRGTGMIIGDQGGIGKGRVVAGVIRWALKNNKTPIFVTEKPNLYKDIVRDLSDIGEGTIAEWANRAIMTNGDEKVMLDDEGQVWLKSSPSTHKTKLEKLMREGELGAYDAIFTTYAQMQTVKGARTIRQDFLQQFGEGAVIIFDESHNAGGAEKKDLRSKEQKASGPILDRAVFARQLIQSAFGVFYSSATYAKRPQVMDLYSKTDMRLAVDNPKALAPAIEKGGVPLQQAVAAMLAEAGQYTRRERDFSGMVYETAEIKVDRAKAEQTSGVMRAIRAFDEAKNHIVSHLNKEARETAQKISGETGSTGKAGVESTNFTSLMHNLVGQMLLMLKVDGTVDEAIKTLKANEKPVITLSNTMGSFIEEYAEENGLKPGDGMGLTFGDMLRRYLERSRDIRIGKAFGPSERRRLTDAELGERGLSLYNKTLEMIQQADWAGMPVSPIDFIKFRLREAGYKTGEITGRSHVIEYSGDGSRQVYRNRPAKETSIAGRARALVEFNNGALDALIINQAGSTGLSIHASSKFKDQRKRVMLIAQPELNIDTHMQMLYRVDRTGQVVKPGYRQLVADIPAEKRPAAILSKKMASLNANTTAAKGSAYEAKDVPDFMNQYGDEVVASIMEDDPDLNKFLGYPLKPAEGATQGLKREDATRKVTGRIPLLEIAKQEHIYELIESEYRDLIAQLDAMGENALEAKTLDLDAKLLKKTEIFPSKGSSPFEQGAWAEESDVKRVGKPYKSDQVLKLLGDFLGATATDLRELQREGAAWTARVTQDVRERSAEYMRSVADVIEDEDRAKAQRVKLNEVFVRWRDLIGRLQPGATIKLDTPLGELHGIVTKIEQKGKPANPSALGSWRATIAVADAVRSVTVPFSKLHYKPDIEDLGDLPANQYTFEPEAFATVLNRETRVRESVPVVEAFDLKQTQSREHRTILTGNLLAAFGRFQKGRVINYTDQAGQVRQGIMMPADFNLETALKAEAVSFKHAEDIVKFLSEAPNSRLVTTPDSTLRINWSHGSLRLATNKSKATGAQYYLNPKILEAAGDEFASSGNNMQMFVDADRAADVLNTIMSLGYELETDSYKDEAKRILAANPKNKGGQRGSLGLRAAGTGYHTGPGKLRGLFDRIRNAGAALRGGPAKARQKFSMLGSLRDIWVGNLSQLEKANEKTFDAALRAAGARTTGKMLMRRAANQVQSILKTKDGWNLFRSALVEGRLRGVRDRWLNLRDLSVNLGDDDFREFYAGGGEDYQTGIRPLVAMLEGMPFGKQFKEAEGFNADDSLVGMVDSLLATDDMNAARSYLSNIFWRAGESVASVMDADDFDTFTGSRLFGKALTVYKNLLERPMNEAHALNEGVFSDALGPLDTYYPLTALDEEGNALHRLRTRVFRGTEYRPPENPRNKMATGLSPMYDVTPEALGSAVSQAERRNTVANLLKVAERQGLVRTLKRNEPAPDTIEVNGEQFTAVTRQKGKDRTLFINGKTIHVPAPRIAIPQWMAKELSPILETDDYSQGNFVKFVAKLNQFGMAGPIDAAAHTANVIGALVVGTPYVGTDILSRTIGNTPVTKLLTAWVNLATTDPWTDDAVRDIEEMTKIGVIPTRYATVTSGWLARGRAFSAQTGAQKKYFSLAPLLYGPAGIDIRARLLMYRLAKTAMPHASIAETKHFIDQLGNYTYELQGSVERFLKTYGISPFYTAGSTMWRTGIKATFGLTPLPSSHETAAKRSILRAQMMLSGGIVGLVGLWVLMHKAYTDKWPWEDENSRLLQIPLNEKHRKHWLAQKVYGKNNKTAYVGIGFFSPLIQRGLRATGITAAYNAKMSGATRGQAEEEAEREIANSVAQPVFSGPVTHAGFVFATKGEPYITSFRDITGKPTVALLPGMKVKEPGVATMKARTIEAIASLNSFYSNVARNIGLVQQTFDLDEGHAAKESASQPNPWLKMVLDLAAPRLAPKPVDLPRQRKAFKTQAKAIHSAVRRSEGLPKLERETEAGPRGLRGPRGPGGS